MPLPLTIDKLDAVPEAARGAYVEKAGKFVLDAEIEDVSGLKAKIADKIAENKRLADRAKVLGDRSPEDVIADLEYAKQAREAKARADGDYEGLKKIQAEELKKKDATITELYGVVGEKDATTAIANAGGKVKKLLGPVMKQVKVVVVDGKAVTQVIDGKGQPRLKDGQGTPFTVEDLVAEFAADEDYANDFAASGASGSNARNQPSLTSRGGIVIIPKDATPQEYRRMKAEAEKAGRQYQIAS